MGDIRLGFFKIDTLKYKRDIQNVVFMFKLIIENVDVHFSSND